MPKHSFVLNGEKVTVDVEDNLRLLWVLRDVLKVTGPKYGCGINVCKACTSHINGNAFNPCSVQVKDIKPTDKITTIEGLADTVKGSGGGARQTAPAGGERQATELHPVQEAWLKHQVPQCGFCQPGQIMTAVALINRKKKAGKPITEADLDEIRNVCRCGTYPRIRDAIRDAAKKM